jgi:class 3 adenylate cyclase
MRDLLDRAFLLVLPSAVKEVLERRVELASGEDRCIEPALIDALEIYKNRQIDDAMVLLQNIMADVDHMSSSSIAYASTILSRCYVRKSKVSEGLQLMEDAQISKHFIGPLAKATYFWDQANMLRFERRFNEAQDALQKSLDLILQSSVPKHAASIICDMATVYLSQGDEARAITLYEQAISEYEKDPDYAEALIRARGNLASAYHRIERVDEALRVYEEILLLPSIENDWFIFIAVKLNRAIALKTLGRMDESFDAYSDVRVLAHDHGDVQIEIRALVGLSDLMSLKEQLIEARFFAEEALAIAVRRGVQPLLIEVQRRIATIDLNEGNASAAIQLMQEAYARLVETGDNSEALRVAEDLEGYLTEEGRFEEALSVLKSSVQIQKMIYAGEIERSVEIASVRERLAKERETVLARDEERTKVLHSVMPAHIANRLTAGERQIVDTLPAVTILFADVVGFTELVSSMTGEALLDLLSKLFAGLDDAAARYGCERIKTIGDSYMAICGASESIENHTERIVRMALAVINGEVQLPFEPSRLRIGINTGPVIAGVMDGQRIAYDVWGDTVNVAARMEEHSRPGSINCTEAVAQRIMQMPEFRLIKREPLSIHGKGLMTTYWVESSRENTADDHSSSTPPEPT